MSDLKTLHGFHTKSGVRNDIRNPILGFQVNDTSWNSKPISCNRKLPSLSIPSLQKEKGELKMNKHAGTYLRMQEIGLIE